MNARTCSLVAGTRAPALPDRARLADALSEALTRLASASGVLLTVQAHLTNVEITITRDIEGAEPRQLSVDDYCAELMAFTAEALPLLETHRNRRRLKVQA